MLTNCAVRLRRQYMHDHRSAEPAYLPVSRSSLVVGLISHYVDNLGLAGSNCLCSMAQRQVTRDGSELVAIPLNLVSGPLSPTSRSLVSRLHSVS